MEKSFQKIEYLTKCDSALEFTKLYLSVRKKENRVLTDEQVQELPNLSLNISHFKEWKIRSKSAFRFLDYLSKKENVKTALDLGCGNGWFSNLIANTFPLINVTGLDINEVELEQASRVFQKENLKFAFADIFKLEPNTLKNKFDLVIFNASVQYFHDFNTLSSLLKEFLKPNGEIHIMDSPFYKKSEVLKAKQRTVDYYTQLGFPEMAKHYFHHSIDSIENFEVLYNPKKININKLLGRKDSPFLWVKKNK